MCFRAASQCIHSRSRTPFSRAYCEHGRQIETGDRGGDVGAFVRSDRTAVPRLVVNPVERMIRNAIFGTKVDVVLRRRRVQPRRERHALFVKPVPPRKRRLARLDPRHVLDRTRGVQLEDRVRFDQLFESLADQDDAPRRFMRQLRADRDARLADARCEPAQQRPTFSLAARKIHARVIGEIRFQDGRPAGARQLDQQRQPEQLPSRAFPRSTCCWYRFSCEW